MRNSVPRIISTAYQRLLWSGGFASLLALGLLGIFHQINAPSVSAQAIVVAPPAAAAPVIEQIAPDEPFEDLQATLADLMVRTYADVQNIRPGEQLTYTIRYTNTLGVPVSGVEIIDTISIEQEYLGGYVSNPVIPTEYFTYTGEDYEGYYLTWDIGTIPANSSGEIKFVVGINPAAEPRLSKAPIVVGNAVIISTSQGGISGGESTEAVMVVGPLFELDKFDTPDPVMPGYLLTYAIHVSNIERIDAAPATSLVISDVLPEKSSFWAASPGGYYNEEEAMIVWNRPGPVLPGETEIVTFSVRIDLDAVSGQTIRNNRAEYMARSAEITHGPIEGKRDIVTTIGKLLQKTVQARRMTGGTALVYPQEFVTYTLTINNPLTYTLRGVVVTDTLPGSPEKFKYINAVAGSPAPDSVSPDGSVLTYIVDLPPWGSVTRAFVARVPEHIAFPENLSNTTLFNTLSASHPDATFTTQDRLAAVRVDAPVTMNKIVAPNHGQPGDSVVYTITLTNRGPYLVNDIRLTDTLPTYFHFVEMRQGPDPLPEFDNNPVVWEDISVNVGQSIQLSFEALVNGNWLVKYYNSLNAISPDTSFPPRTRLAGVTVDPPLGLNKTVTPTSAFLNSQVTYAITVTNLSTVTWVLDEVSDYLPTGFYQVGGGGTNPAVIEIDPPASITPGDAWSGEFTAYLGMDVGCSTLPKTFKNDPGDVLIHLLEPYDIYAVNAVALAPLDVNPHVEVDVIPFREWVEPGDYLTYTLDLNNISQVSANNASLILTLPPEVTYLSTLSGPAPAVNGQTLTWSGFVMSAGAHRVIQIYTQISENAAPGYKNITFSAVHGSVCFGAAGTGDHPIGTGRIRVVEPYGDPPLCVFETESKPVFSAVPPRTLTEIELRFKNNDYYPFTMFSVVNTMPPGFTFYEMKSGPEPQVVGNQLVWTNQQAAGRMTTSWKVILMSSPLYQSGPSLLDVQLPDTVICKKTGYVTVAPLFDLKKSVSAPFASPNDYITYKIELVNLSDAPYTAIRLTDTLPAGFQYVQMLTGYPTPVSVGPNNSQPVWEDLSLDADCPKGCILTLEFIVLVGANVPDGTYYNTVIGKSPSGGIPGPIETAPIVISQTPMHPLYIPSVMRSP